MTPSLYAATIPSKLQMLSALLSIMDKAQAHSAEQGVGLDELVKAQLAPDMLPLAYQIRAAADYSAGAIDAVRKGVFGPNMDPAPEDFAALRGLVAKAHEALSATEATEIDSLVGRPMLFAMGDFKIHFTTEDFLLSFVQPSFYFHVVTAYDILRWKGLPIGKLDFLGQLRTEKAPDAAS